VFATKGLGEATARDIVRETDLATGTFYNYFDSKEHVFRALLEPLATKARAAVRVQRTRSGATLEDRIHDAYHAYFEIAVEDAELFAVLRRNAGAIAMMREEALFESGVAELFGDLGAWANGAQLPDVDLGYLETAMLGTGFQVAAHLMDCQRPDVEAAANFCTKLFMGGIPALPAG